MREFIITSDQMKMLAESVGYFVDEPIGEVVIGGETLPDVGELRTESAKLRELSSIMLKCIMANERRALICWECPMHKQFDELRSYCCLEHEAKELGIEVPA